MEGQDLYFTNNNGKEDDKNIKWNMMNSVLMCVSFYNSIILSSRKIGEQGQSRKREA